MKRKTLIFWEQVFECMYYIDQYVGEEYADTVGLEIYKYLIYEKKNP